MSNQESIGSVGRGRLGGAKVVSFESRRAKEMADLIRRHGGVSVVAPSMRELPLEDNQAASDFLGRLEAGEIDVVVAMTGVGIRTLVASVAQACPPERLVELLEHTTLVARGPKPVVELRKLGLSVQVKVPEPNTSRELLATIDRESPVRGKRVAVIEYGVRNEELLAGLEDRSAAVVPVAVYRWALPEDTGPLRGAVAMLARGESDYVLFTSGTQVEHVMKIAGEMDLSDAVKEAMSRSVVASIGPVCSEVLRRNGLPVHLEPEHPKMGHLVVAVAKHESPDGNPGAGEIA